MNHDPPVAIQETYFVYQTGILQNHNTNPLLGSPLGSPLGLV